VKWLNVLPQKQGLIGVSVSQVEINATLAFFDGIKTEDIHETIIKSAEP
jgi:ribonucleoside-diphosphate reductase alpha chain